MRRAPSPLIFWPILVLVSAIPRILGAFVLPNAFGDAYVYIRDIGAMSAKLSAGTFALTDLFGFWLPLYQFISALINVFVGNGFYVGKVVSAVFGIGACLMVYAITLRLTEHRLAALLAFAVIALNPLHIFYSASAMTDVPHAFFVLASLYFCLKQRWILAAFFAALAGLTRVESWMFIGLIPAIQFFKQRRITPIAIMILAAPPLFWFYVSWKAAGNWLACFDARRQYHDWLVAANPTLAHFSFSHVVRDGATLLFSTDLAVMSGCFVAGWFVIKPWAWGKWQQPDRQGRLHSQLNSNGAGVGQDLGAIGPALVFFFAFLGLIVVAYVSGRQPIIFPRYGLILFTLGIPILAWTFLTVRSQRPQWARRLLVLVIAICVFDAGIELVGSIGLLNQISEQRAVADYLHAHFQADAYARIFCDEGTVLAMSAIPPEKFLTSSDAPRDAEHFLTFLEEKNVEYLVFIDKEDSTPAKLFPELQNGQTNEVFEPIMHASTRFVRTDIWMYRVHGQQKK